MAEDEKVAPGQEPNKEPQKAPPGQDAGNQASGAAAGADENLEWLNGLIKAVGVLQARTMVQHYILRDLVIQIAKAQSEPSTYAAEMFERVSRLVDQCDFADKPDIEAEMRWYAESFFTAAGNTASKS